jgi:hypothetical protein
MSSKGRQTVDDLYGQRFHNAPESEAVTLNDTAIFEAARQAGGLLKKTFETWIVMGRGVVRAREIADRRGGGKTFMRLIEQQGLSRFIDKTTASHLERIMEHVAEVTAWHETLTDKQKTKWAAPTTILTHCPIFKKPKVERTEPTPAERDRMALAAALEENERLKQREDGDRFKPTDTAADIATVLVGMFKPAKAKEIAGRMMALLKKREPGKRAEAGGRATRQ